MNPPLIIMPNFTQEPGHPHDVLLAARPEYVAGGLPLSADQFDVDPVTANETIIDTFMYAELPPAGVSTGIEIDLRKSGVTFSGGLEMDRGQGSTAECPEPFTTTPKASLHWLPQLTKVSKATHLTLREAFIKRDPAREDVLLRMELPGGRLEAELTPQMRKYQFVIDGQPASDDVVQTVAMSLNYTFTINLPPGGTFILRGRKFGAPGEANDLVELGRFKPGDDSRIVLDLMNMPKDDFFHQHHDTASIPHFHLHYRILNELVNEAVPMVKDDACPVNANRPQFECGPAHL
jgi:hypothetical protein